MSDLKKMVREIPNWPKPNVMFKDITPILKDKEAFNFAINKLSRKFRKMKIDKVASAESRGFILGSALAYKLKAGFVPLRKPGKLPWNTIKEEYDLEYGKDAFEVHVDGIEKGDKVLIVDDVLATGGTMKAAINLVKKLGGEICGIALLIELKELNGRKKLLEDVRDDMIYSLMKFDK
ncbi:MAG: adenine phosphoribosyltransferase [Candidatus Micrarchaeia archaeon]